MIRVGRAREWQGVTTQKSCCTASCSVLQSSSSPDQLQQAADDVSLARVRAEAAATEAAYA